MRDVRANNRDAKDAKDEVYSKSGKGIKPTQSLRKTTKKITLASDALA